MSKCGDCTLCCIWPDDGMRPILDTTELSSYDVERIDKGYSLKMTKEKHCVYLDSRGCSIYQYRPQVCREFDCTSMVSNISESAIHFSKIIAKGVKRLEDMR